LDLDLAAGGSDWLLMRVQATEIVGSLFDGSGHTQARGDGRRRRSAASGGGLTSVAWVQAGGSI
jgi:hypothetical protein